MGIEIPKYSMTTLGERWPSGGFHEIALIRISRNEIENFFGTQLATGIENGLGEWESIGFRFEHDEYVELISYKNRPENGFFLRADILFNPEKAIDKTIKILGKKKADIIWSCIST